MLDKTNVIDVVPGEPRKDLAVIIAGQDKDWATLLKKEFPRAQWNPVWQYYQTKNDVPFLYDVVIPAAEIPEKPGKVFMARVVPDCKWRRRIYTTYFGLCRGMIKYEDLSPALNPPPAGGGALSISADGDWEIPADGDYTFSINSPNPTQIWVDGQRALCSVTADWVKPRTVSHTIFLTKGVHHLRYMTYLRSNAWFERVTIENSKAGYKEVLGG